MGRFLEARTFRYPGPLRFFPWVGVVFFPAMLVLTAVLYFQGELEPGLAVAMAAVFGLFFLAMLYLLPATSARITLTNQELIWERWGARRTMNLASITRLEHRITGNAVIVHGPQHSIRVEEQLDDFPSFFEALLELLPEEVRRAERAVLPLECGTRLLPRLFVEAPFLLGAIGLAYGVYAENWYYAGAGAGTVLLLGIGIGMLPRRYRFSEEEIACVTLFRTNRFPADQLARLHVNVVHGPAEYGGQQHRTLVLEFVGGRKLNIPSGMIAYPIHKLQDLLSSMIRAD